MFAPESKKENSCTSLSSLMQFCFEQSHSFVTEDNNSKPTVNLTTNWYADTLLFESGTFADITSTTHTGTTEEIKIHQYISQKSSRKLSLRLHSTDYFSERESKVNYGNIMHELLNKIEIKEDMEQAVSEMMHTGKINVEESLEIKEKLNYFLNQEIVKNWFSTQYKIINETDIITPEQQLYRPDRVLIKQKQAIVIDYKFGNRQEKKHQQQIKHYMQLIRKMGYDTEAYICYVELDKVEKVEA